MGAIDIGLAALDRVTTGSIRTNTFVTKDNPANDTGAITDAEIWLSLSVGSDVWFGTFSAAGNVLTCRDSESVGAVAGGSKQTFSGLDIDVVTGDYWGTHSKSGSFVQIEQDTAGGGGRWHYAGEVIDPTDSQTFTLSATIALSLYGTGETPAGWAGGDVGGVTIGTIAKINGVALADITKVNGVA